MTTGAGSPLTVRVLFFASWKEVAGGPEIELRLPHGSTAADALEAIIARWPALASRASHATLAINHAYAAPNQALNPGDELAIVPPVSGGNRSEIDRVRVGPEPLDPGAVSTSVIRADCGAVCTFTGTTRNHYEGKRVEGLEYEAYAPMAEREIRALIEQARELWALGAIAIEHRIGPVPVGEASVVIAVSSPHRADGFEAGRYLIDSLKETVPIWKREHYEGGSAWIEGSERRPVRNEDGG